MNTRTYAIINTKDIKLIDFSQINETSINTVRKSIDQSQFVIKWEDGHTPTFITDESVKPVGTYNYNAILVIMESAEWSEQLNN